METEITSTHGNQESDQSEATGEMMTPADNKDGKPVVEFGLRIYFYSSFS